MNQFHFLPSVTWCWPSFKTRKKWNFPIHQLSLLQLDILKIYYSVDPSIWNRTLDINLGEVTLRLDNWKHACKAGLLILSSSLIMSFYFKWLSFVKYCLLCVIRITIGTHSKITSFAQCIIIPSIYSFFFQFKVTTLHWSPVCKDLIVSGDEKGALVCWDLANNDSKLFIPETNQIFSLSCSPHDASHVAVGYVRFQIWEYNLHKINRLPLSSFHHFIIFRIWIVHTFVLTPDSIC